MSILDRYVLREALTPFLLALGMFTFLLQVNPMLFEAQKYLAKGVDLGTVVYLLALLLPQALGVTLPMALMAGLLMALGRLSADRESVALLACGVSPARLLRPVLLLALLVAAADLYVMTRLIPDFNQKFREVSFRLLAKQGESDIKAGVFYEGFPGKVLFVREVLADGGWAGVMLADTSKPGRPALTVAPYGFLDLEPAQRQVSIVLTGRPIQYSPGTAEGVYDTVAATELRFAVPAESVFGDGNAMPVRGRAEMTIADLKRVEAEKMEAGRREGLDAEGMFKAGLSPHPEILQRHQMFSFPVASFVFALMAVVLGLHTRREGKLGGFTLGLVVIAAYYGVMALAESLTKGGHFPAVWARWVPNIVFGLLGLLALVARMRSTVGNGTLTLPAWLGRAATWRSSSRSPVAATAQASRPVVVIRLPVFRVPQPRILDRYVAWKYLSVAAVSFGGLLLLYYIGTFVDRSDRLFKGQASASQLVEYFVYATPQFIVYLVPTATLVAVLATIGGLTRTGELTVMRACGVSLYRVAAPLLVLAAVWSGGLFLMDDRVLAHANRRAKTLEDEIRGLPPRTMDVAANANWLADPTGRLYYYSTYDTRRNVLLGLSVFEPTADRARLASHMLIPRAAFRAGEHWRVEGGWIQRFPAPDKSTRQVMSPRDIQLVPPDRFSREHREAADLMTLSDMRRYIAELGDSGISLTDTKVRLQERLAFPLVTIVMTLIGIPFGVSTGRRGALYGVGLAIILGAGYYLVNMFFLAVGSAGLLAPALAAWAANLLFLAVALYAVFTVRT